MPMLIGEKIAKRGGIHQEIDVPAQLFLNEMTQRGIAINYRIETVQEFRQEALAAAAQEN